ncbi:TPA: hypothetical protein ACH3X1_002431 [Trebouxia sp. C0004]
MVALTETAKPFTRSHFFLTLTYVCFTHGQVTCVMLPLSTSVLVLLQHTANTEVPLWHWYGFVDCKPPEAAGHVENYASQSSVDSRLDMLSVHPLKILQMAITILSVAVCRLYRKVHTSDQGQHPVIMNSNLCRLQSSMPWRLACAVQSVHV